MYFITYVLNMLPVTKPSSHYGLMETNYSAPRRKTFIKMHCKASKHRQENADTHFSKL